MFFTHSKYHSWMMLLWFSFFFLKWNSIFKTDKSVWLTICDPIFVFSLNFVPCLWSNMIAKQSDLFCHILLLKFLKSSRKIPNRTVVQNVVCKDFLWGFLHVFHALKIPFLDNVALIFVFFPKVKLDIQDREISLVDYLWSYLCVQSLFCSMFVIQHDWKTVGSILSHLAS